LRRDGDLNWQRLRFALLKAFGHRSPPLPPRLAFVARPS